MTSTRRQWLAGAGAALLWPAAARSADYVETLRRQVGEISPETAWRRLWAEHRRLTARATRLFDRLGQSDGDLGARYSALSRDERHLYPDSDAGRAAAVADMSRWLAVQRANVRRVIDDVPPECLNLDIRALSPAEIAAGRMGYRELPAPGRRGAYVVDLKDTRRRPRWTLPSVVAHELLPGHLLQGPTAARAGTATADARHFGEGWAIYAETLATYADPLNELGRLHWLLFRVGRALIDIGINDRGWTATEARARLVAWQGEPAYFASFDVDVARVAREPGARVAEAMTWLTIVDRARGRTGAALRAYHAAVLAGGPKRIEALPR